jgi:modulator of FtsH protease
MGAVLFLAISFGFFFAIEKFKDSGVGVLLLLGFTFFMGLMLSRLLGFALGMEHGARAIGLAFGGTAAVFAGMATIASTTKRDLSGMGKWMAGGALVILVMGLANIWLQMPALHLALCAMAVVVFSAFIVYDLKRVIDGGETNYVTATLAIYLNVYNVFTSLLQIILSLTGNDD